MAKFIKHSAGFNMPFALGVYCAVIVVGITATFIDVLEASKIAEIFWLILGICWAVMSGYNLTSQGGDES